MRHLDRVRGIAIGVLSGAAFCGCQAPPPTAAPADLGQMAPIRLAVSVDPVDHATQFGSIPPVGATTASGISAAKVLAPYSPPPKRAEIPPAAPSPQALWVDGNWRWTGAHFVWLPGRYIDRPQSDANWIPGYWEHQGGGWVWVEGRWT
jgi:hypothetical protein